MRSTRLPRKRQPKRRLRVSSDALLTTAAGNWDVLRARIQQGGVEFGDGLGVPTIPTTVSTYIGPVRLAIGKNGEARVLIPLAHGEVPANIHGGNGLSISVSSFNHMHRVYRFLDLICLSPDLEAVFGELADEILARISRGIDCLEAAQSTIEDFRSLLVQRGGGEISKRRIAGLIAELLVLNRLLKRSSSAWKAWRGPAGNRHDYRAGDMSLEVKASLRPDASTITINGLEQLEVPNKGTLHLLRIVLECVQGGMLSVSSLAGKAISKASKPESLRELLAAMGCSDIDAERWNRHRFRTESEHLYEIRPGFPRLTMSMLTGTVVPHGVHRVSYHVDLSVADPFLCKKDELTNLEEMLCS